MKIFYLSLASLLFATISQAQESPHPPPLVSTRGSAEIRVVPDVADLSFEVEVRNADLTIARKQEEDRAAKVIAALRAAGVTEAELQTSQVMITADYSDRRSETEKARFYRVSQDVTCTLHDLKKVPDVTADAVAAGVTGVRNASLRTSELRKYRDQARSKAVQAAKEKAAALAGELGAKLGKPYAITEGGSFDSALSNNAQQVAIVSAQPEDTTQPAFAPGMIRVTANVEVSFLLE
jgi:hypothetical protein